MDTRYYPLKEVDFIKEVELYSTLPYKRSGGRAVISHYSFFCAVLYVLRTGVSWHKERGYLSWDKERYKTRSAMEQFLGKIKEHKPLALRFDKLDVTFFSFFALGCLKVFNLFC